VVATNSEDPGPEVETKEVETGQEPTPSVLLGLTIPENLEVEAHLGHSLRRTRDPILK
jgi:hypothetical protein